MKWHCWLTVCALVVSCGQQDQVSSPSSSDQTGGDDGVAYDKIVDPPKEYYDAALLDNLAMLELAGDLPTPVLYLDFDGATLEKGFQTGQSFILCSRQATIPPSDFSPSEQEQIVERVLEFFQNAGTNLQVVDQQPAQRPYTTLLVGGSYGDLGCGDSRSTLGVAPLDDGNVNKNDIGFAFTRYVNSVRVVAETIAHEAGHSYGLDHIRERNGLMYASNSGAIEGFIDGTVGFGRQQNAPEILQADVGKSIAGETSDPVDTLPPANPTPTPVATTPPAGQPGTNVPTIPGLPGGLPGLDQIGGLGDLLGGLNPGQIGGGLDLDAILGDIGGLFPGLGTGPITLPGGLLPDFGQIGGLTGLDDLLGLIGLAGQVPSGTNLPGGLGNISDLADLLGGFNTPNLGGLDDLLGLIPGSSGLDLNDLLANLGGLFGGGSLPGLIPGFPLAGGGTQIPDLSGLLGLDQIKDLPTLFRTMEAHGAYINQNYSGHQRDALLSALKVGYAQAYRSME